METPAFAPGFRFSGLDGFVLAIGAAAAIGVGLVDAWIGIGIGFVVLHFFLFCNVLRMARPLELIWAGLFVVTSALATAGIVTWPICFAVSIIATCLVAGVQLRRPSYHGVGWRRINPRLPDWWQARTTCP